MAKIILVYLFSIFSILSLFGFPKTNFYFVYNVSPSVPMGLYKVSEDQILCFNDYVYNSSSGIIKQVRGVPGNFIEMVDGYIIVCGIRYILKTDMMMSVCPLGEIPEGVFFLAGDHPLSFDSRYFGLVSEDKLIRIDRIERKM